jgi:Flp pilus assembly protein TadG
MSLSKRFIKTFHNNNDGATAVEFGFFAIPFVFLLIGMVEVGMLSTAGTLLQGGTDDAARLIRTGQAQSSGDPQAAFEDLLCEKVELLINCDDLVFEAIAIDSSANGFGGIADDMSLVDPTFDGDGNLDPSGFDSGSHSSLVIVRVAYNYPLMTPFVGPFLADNTNNTKLLMATAIIQNEPYDF